MCQVRERETGDFTVQVRRLQDRDVLLEGVSDDVVENRRPQIRMQREAKIMGPCVTLLFILSGADAPEFMDEYSHGNGYDNGRVDVPQVHSGRGTSSSYARGSQAPCKR